MSARLLAASTAAGARLHGVEVRTVPGMGRGVFANTALCGGSRGVWQGFACVCSPPPPGSVHCFVCHCLSVCLTDCLSACLSACLSVPSTTLPAGTAVMTLPTSVWAPVSAHTAMHTPAAAPFLDRLSSMPTAAAARSGDGQLVPAAALALLLVDSLRAGDAAAPLVQAYVRAV